MNSIFKVENLSIGYQKKNPILENINLELKRGEISCLLGANGSGKSTFVKSLSKLIKPVSGSISYSNPCNISIVPQYKKMQMHYPLKVKDVLKLSNKFNFFAKRNPDDESLISRMGIESIQNLLLKECSGGQLQKVLIARSLLSNANLIFLDEPLDALDINSKKLIVEILLEQAKEFQKTFFIITHNIDSEWLNNFNRVFQINEKSIIEKK